MKTGDLVQIRNKFDETGIVIFTDAGLFATWLTVQWPDGQKTVHDSSELRKVDEKG